MLEIEAASLSIGIVSLLANLFLIQYIRRNDIVLKLITFSLITDAIVSFSTIITSSQRLLQENGTSSNPHRLFYYSSAPIWIFADILQVAFCLNFSIDRFINFATPIFYSRVSAVYNSRFIFIAVISGCFVFSGLLTYEVQKVGDFVGYNGTVCSFLREEFFNVYFDILFWICFTAFLICMLGLMGAVIRSKNKGYWEDLQNNSYFLFPNSLICVIRNFALIVSYYVAHWLMMDKYLLLSVARLLSTIALLILQPGSLYVSLSWYNKHQASKKLDLSNTATDKKHPKNSTAAAIVGPALMIDVAALSLFTSPVINLNMTTKGFMEQRAEKERSVSFYQVVRHEPQNVFMPETPFGDMYSDPFD